MDLNQALANMIKTELKAKTFSSGSKGFHATGKINVDGVRYQAQAQAVLIGSKANPAAKVIAGVEEAEVALVAFTEDGLRPKTFRSGNSGYYATGKTEVGGQPYQVQAQAVRIS